MLVPRTCIQRPMTNTGAMIYAVNEDDIVVHTLVSVRYVRLKQKPPFCSNMFLGFMHDSDLVRLDTSDDN